MKPSNYSTVNFQGLHPDMLPMMMKVDAYWRNEVGYELIVTSARNGNHTRNSRHYIGCAIDMRTWTTADSGIQLPDDRRVLLQQDLEDLLKDNFQILDLVYPVRGTSRYAKTHFHIQLVESSL